MYDNCSTCHHDGGIAPFPLMSYDSAVVHAFTIMDYVDARKMPPWPADPTYSHFKDEKVLEQDEIDAIDAWVLGGLPEGDPNLAPVPPVYNGEILLPVINDTVTIPSYTVTTDVDDYRSFVIHSGYTDTTYLNQVQFVAGDPSMVHHVFMFQDTSDISYQTDEATPEPGFYASGMGGFSQYAQVFMGYIPGTDPVKFPLNWGYLIPPSSDYCFSFHYGPGSTGKTDSSKMYLKYCDLPDSVIRPVMNQRLLWWFDSSLINGPFVIPANVVKDFYAQSPDFQTPLSIVAIQPHMHLIGKSIEVFMVIGADTTNLIKIPQWDFNWQINYFVTKLIKIPVGAKIYDHGIYDNTSNNPNNPNDPPITVHNGEGTEDEMMSVRFSLLDYRDGDENYILDSAFYPIYEGAHITEYDLGVKVFPNPANDELWFNAWLPDHEVDWTFSNITGVIMQESHERNIWNGSYTQQIDISKLPTGVYFLTIKSGKERAIRKVVVEN